MTEAAGVDCTVNGGTRMTLVEDFRGTRWEWSGRRRILPRESWLTCPTCDVRSAVTAAR